MENSTFKQRLAASRISWVAVSDGREVQFSRPSYKAQCELKDKSPGEEVFMINLLLACAVDWKGFIESDFIGCEGQDEVPFDSDVLQVLLDSPMRANISKAFVDFWIRENDKKDSAIKN